MVGPQHRQKCTSRAEPGCKITGVLSGKNMANLNNIRQQPTGMQSERSPQVLQINNTHATNYEQYFPFLSSTYQTISSNFTTVISHVNKYLKKNLTLISELPSTLCGIERKCQKNN